MQLKSKYRELFGGYGEREKAIEQSSISRHKSKMRQIGPLPFNTAGIFDALI